jgi:hypothetical protein
MLARPAPLPTGAGWRFEPKLDGFRRLAYTHGDRFVPAAATARVDCNKIIPGG